MTAYEILDAVRDKGITAPPTVYRALNRLVEEGLAHRVESINAYVACAHSHHSDGAVVFAICDNCGYQRLRIRRRWRCFAAKPRPMASWSSVWPRRFGVYAAPAGSKPAATRT
jgi:hypothetical protein